MAISMTINYVKEQWLFKALLKMLRTIYLYTPADERSAMGEDSSGIQYLTEEEFREFENQPTTSLDSESAQGSSSHRTRSLPANRHGKATLRTARSTSSGATGTGSSSSATTATATANSTTSTKSTGINTTNTRSISEETKNALNN